MRRPPPFPRLSAGISVGVPLAASIGIHNVPEGLAVGLHVYFATKSRGAAVGVSLASGAAEPLAVLLAALAVGDAPSPAILGPLLAAVAGVMTSLSVVELLPSAAALLGAKLVVAVAVAGALAMTSGLQLAAWLQA